MARLCDYLALAGLVGLVSCTSAVAPRVPQAAVYYHLHLQDSRHRALLSPGGIVRITQPETAQDRLGNAGLAVVRSVEQAEEFYAFDLACPGEHSQGAQLEVKGMRLVCPSCGSAFEVLQGTGRPEEGSAQSPLRRYRVIRMDRYHLLVTS